MSERAFTSLLCVGGGALNFNHWRVCVTPKFLTATTLLAAVAAGWLLLRAAALPDDTRTPAAVAAPPAVGSPQADTVQPTAAQAGAVGAIGHAETHAFAWAQSARVPVAPGSRAWRFDKPKIGDVSAGTLYARLAQREIDPATARDAAVFAEIIRRCRHRAKEQRMLQAEEAEAARASEFERRQTELLRESIRETDALCADAPADASERSDAWLTRAAQLGDPLAKFYYASGRLGWTAEVVEIYKNPERWAAYKPQALQYLQELALRGHYDSMILLSTLYLSPVWGPDRALSWAYLFAAARAEGDTLKQTRFLKQLESLAPEERARAEREAERIFGQCCA